MIKDALIHGKWKELVIVLGISLILTFTIGRKVVFSLGYIMMAEQFEVYTLDSFTRVFFPLWNENLQSFNFADLTKIYLYGLITLVIKLLDLSYKELQRVLLLTPHSISFVSMYYLTKYVLIEKEKEGTIFFSIPSLVSAWVYTINPWIAFHPRNILLRFEYAFLPLIMTLYIKMLDSDKKKTIEVLLFSILLSIVSGYRFIVLLIPAFVLYALVSLLYENSRLVWLKITLKQLIRASVLFSLISFAKFYPALLYSLRLGTSNIIKFREDMIKGFPLLEVISMRISPNAFNITYLDTTSYLFLIITFFSFICIFLLKQQKFRKITLFSVLLFFMYLPLSVLNYGIFAKIIPWALITLHSYGRIFRHGHWNSVFVLLSVSLMTGMSILKVEQVCKINFKKLIVSFLVVVIFMISAISAWPLLSGDMNGYWKASMIPQDYIQVNDYLGRQLPDFHVLWLPPFGGNRATWDRSTGIYPITSPTGIFAVRSSAKPSYHTSAFYFYDFFNPIGPRKHYRSIVGYQGENLGKIYSNINVQYLVIHYDGLWTSQLTNEKLELLCEKLEENLLIDRIYNGEYLSFFELPKSQSKISDTLPIFIVGGLSSYGSLIDSGVDEVSSFSPIFIEDVRNVQKVSSLNTTSMVLINKDNAFISLIFSILGDRKITTIKPASTTKVYEPYKTWSVTSTDSVLFQNVLNKNNIRKWDWGFDYGKGLVITKAPAIIRANIKLKPENLIAQWHFNSHEQISGWISNRPDQQIIFLDQNVLKAEFNNTSSDLIQIRSPLIPVIQNGAYIIKYKIKGENVDNLYTSIKEFDENRTQLESQIFDIKKPNTSFDWIHISHPYVVLNSNSEYIQLRIEYYDVTSNPSLKEIWLDDMSIFDSSNYTKPNIIDMSFKVETSEKKDLFVRYFENQAGGMFRIHVDNRVVADLDTKSQLNRFIWEKIATLELEKGKHEVALENVHGFNAVNLIAIASSSEYVQTENELHKSLKGKRLVYLFEPENDLYKENAIVTQKKELEASNGQIVELKPGSLLWQEIENPNNQTYRLALRGNGMFQINIANHTSQIVTSSTNSTTSLNWAYSTPIPLQKGTHKLQIKSLSNSDLDSIWLYTITNSNETLTNIFKVDKPTKIVSFKKIDPTKYLVEVNVTEPFMLSFAEAYDPLWIARVKGKKISSIPLYSVINGFWINQTGEFDITIEYEPQKWFYYGSAISITSLLGSIVYLIWDWKRKHYTGSKLDKTISFLRNRIYR